MRAPKLAAIAHKKPDTQKLEKRRAEPKPKKEKKSTATGAPKRPPTAFFVFMEQFRKSFKENHPDNKSITAVTKSGGDKWKSMTESEKAPYFMEAKTKKDEYEKAIATFKLKLNEKATEEEAKPEASEDSTSEAHEGEASS